LRKWSPFAKVRGFGRTEFDLTDPIAPDALLGAGDFDWVVNCAAATNVDLCERQPELARMANAEAPGRIAQACAKSNTRLIHIGTDYVFDGVASEPIGEETPVSPISVYGQSKADGDCAVMDTLPDGLVCRVSWVFGPERPSFVDQILTRARLETRVAAVDDKWSSPSYADDLAEWLAALISTGSDGGVYHLCNRGGCTWREYGEYALRCAADAGVALQTTTVEPQSMNGIAAFIAKRPVHTILSTAKFERATGTTPSSWQDAVSRYLHEQIARGLL